MLFSELKPKQKTFLTEVSYQDVLAEYVLGMLEYPNFPVEIEYVRYLDFLLLKEGKAALYKSKHWGRWVIGNVSFEGIDLNEYGMLQDAHVFDRAGHDELFKDWLNSQDCFVFFNNRNHTPDINIPRYADLLAKIDISLNANIVNSRMSPIVVAKDNNTKNQLAEIIKQNHDGHTEVITSPNILNEEGDNITVVNITDVNASDKIQYLLHAKDDLTREFLNLYGLHITGTGKMAQQSVEEITGSNNAALVIPYEMMKARNDTLERFNAITGLNVVCQLSKSWEREEYEAEGTVKDIYQMQPEQPLLEDNEGSSEDTDEQTNTEEVTQDTLYESEIDASDTSEGAEASSDFAETAKSTIAEEVAERAEEGLTVEAEANTLPLDEAGRRIIEDADNDTDSLSDQSDTSGTTE